jgi:hypothetical protein
MPPTMIKILGTAMSILVGAAIGGVTGIFMSYTLSIIKPQYPFNYGLAFIIGVVAGTYGLIYSIRDLWLR